MHKYMCVCLNMWYPPTHTHTPKKTPSLSLFIVIYFPIKIDFPFSERPIEPE